LSLINKQYPLQSKSAFELDVTKEQCCVAHDPVLLVWTWLVFVLSIIVIDENCFEIGYKYNDTMQKKTM